MIAFRLSIFLVGAGILLYAGWIAQGWRLEAQRAKRVDSELRTVQEKAAQADRQREAVVLLFDSAEKQLAAERAKKQKEIVLYVPSSPDCNLGPKFVSLLNSARSGQLPSAAGSPPP